MILVICTFQFTVSHTRYSEPFFSLLSGFFLYINQRATDFYSSHPDSPPQVSEDNDLWDNCRLLRQSCLKTALCNTVVSHLSDNVNKINATDSLKCCSSPPSFSYKTESNSLKGAHKFELPQTCRNFSKLSLFRQPKPCLTLHSLILWQLPSTPGPYPLLPPLPANRYLKSTNDCKSIKWFSDHRFLSAAKLNTVCTTLWATSLFRLII